MVNGCNNSQDFVYTATDACSGLTSTSTSTYTWQVVTAPVLAGVPTGGALGCNPTLPTCSTGVTASNECGSVAVTCTPGTVVVNGCSNSQGFVYATDAELTASTSLYMASNNCKGSWYLQAVH
ncbi:MAG: hypothetical protein IPI46_01260 [Bacteroidetes bacterium]|nr:hypothetical protein [Bacteroidota bacterium]